MGLSEASCLPSTEYFFVSNQPFPNEFRITFKNSEQTNKIIDTCVAEDSYIIDSSNGRHVLNYGTFGQAYAQGMTLQIIDLGENCENDAIFFEEAVIPVDSAESRYKKTFNLEN